MAQLQGKRRKTWHPYWQRGLGIWHGLLGNWSRAAREVAAAAEGAPDDALTWFLLGEFRWRQDQVAEAAQAYRQVLRLRPDLARAQAALGRALLRLGLPGEAHKWLSLAVASQPQMGAWWEDLGAASASLGLHPEALAQLTQAAALGEKSEPLAELRSLVLAKLGRYREAAVGLRQAVLRNPRDPLLLNNLAFCLAGIGQLEDALRYYLRAIALAPTDEELLLNLASCLQRLNRHTEALEYLARLVTPAATTETALSLARSYLALRDPGKALQALAPEIRRYPKSLELQLLRARARLEQGQMPRAEALYRYLHRSYPDRAEPLWGLGRCLEAAGEKEESLRLYNLAIDAEKRNTV